jgi:hypothetical protein
MGATTTEGTGLGSAEGPIRGIGPVHKILQNNEIRAAFEPDGQDIIQRLDPLSFAITTVTSSSYDAGTESETVILADASSNPITVNLPPALDNLERVFYVKKIDNVNNVTIDGDGSETIDGQPTAILSTQYQCLTLISNGSQWFII